MRDPIRIHAMPHLIFEFTANLRADADIGALLAKANQVLMAQRDGGQQVFPTGAIRSRAIALEQWSIADGSHDDAFVHAHLKMGAGRAASVRQATGDALFDMMKAHFADLFARRGLALSLEISEFSESGTWKQNNLHARYRASARVDP
jgi:5-carboxymethyl-2-hydroxymuconate isomerase